MESAGAPKTEIGPASALTRPTMLRISVLLPAPLGPRRPRHSPLGSSSVMPSTAVTWPKRLTSPSIRNGRDELWVALVGNNNGRSPRGPTPYDPQHTNEYAAESAVVSQRGNICQS